MPGTSREHDAFCWKTNEILTFFGQIMLQQLAGTSREHAGNAPVHFLDRFFQWFSQKQAKTLEVTKKTNQTKDSRTFGSPPPEILKVLECLVFFVFLITSSVFACFYENHWNPYAKHILFMKTIEIPRQNLYFSWKPLKSASKAYTFHENHWNP